MAIKVNTASPKTGRELEVDFEFGNTLQEAIDLFGEEVVYSNYKKSAVIALQALVRRNLDKDGEKQMSEEDIIKAVGEWKPSVARIIGASQKEALFTKIEKLSDEDRKALIAKLLGPSEAE